MYSQSYYNNFVGQGYKVKFSFRLALPEGKTWQPLRYVDRYTLREETQSFNVYTHYSNEAFITPDVENFDWMEVEMPLDNLVKDYLFFFATVKGDTRAFFLDLPRGHRSGYIDEVNPGGVDQTVHQDIIVYMSQATISK